MIQNASPFQSMANLAFPGSSTNFLGKRSQSEFSSALKDQNENLIQERSQYLNSLQLQMSESTVALQTTIKEQTDHIKHIKDMKFC